MLVIFLGLIIFGINIFSETKKVIEKNESENNTNLEQNSTLTNTYNGNNDFSNNGLFGNTNLNNTGIDDNSSLTNTGVGGNSNLNNTQGGTNTIGGGNTGTVTPNTKPASTYTVKFEGFEFYVPDDLLYMVDSTNNALNVGNTQNTWLTKLEIIDISYSELKQNTSKIKLLFMQQLKDATISEPKVENINGVEYIVTEITI